MLVEETEEQALPLEARATPPPSIRSALPVPSRATVTIPEATFRVRRLKSANNPPISIAPNRKVAEAITTMLLRDFSQLPVMSGEREVKGIITFKSILECSTSGRDLDGEVREYMNTSAFEIRIDDPLLDVIGDIIRNEYALVREKGKIVGIVTHSDLSEQFKQLSEPFLVINQIENHLRSLIQARIPEDTLQGLNGADFEAPRREVKSVYDLGFGDYQRLLHDNGNWERLRVRADKGVFHGELEKVRKIRNNVMHFDPDGITPKELTVLQEFAKLLRTLEGRRG
jgi:predicted transcriptional regulator